jgi:hypothetical protein
MKTPWMPIVLVAAVTGAVGFALGRQAPRDEPSPSAVAYAPAETALPELPMLPEEPDMPAAAPDATLEGVLREHQDVAQYTYLHLAVEGGDTWAAVYKAPVKDGQTVVVEHAARLEGFHSRELNRDFPEIWFGTLPATL